MNVKKIIFLLHCNAHGAEETLS